MNDRRDLESFYTQARQALKAKDYDRASDLLRQILLIDENYKDTSRLLAKTVKLRRRRWYSDPRVWGALGFVVIIALGVFLAPRLQGLYASPPTSTLQPTSNPTMTILPATTATATETPLPAPTTVPLTWKRVWVGQEFPRDTVTAFAVDPRDPDVLYAGMKNAGIYKSIDGGLSWHPALNGLTEIHIDTLFIDAQDTEIVYAGTASGIFQTKDGGENWARISEGTRLLIDPTNNSHLYARDVDNIYESMDQGKTWKSVYSSQSGCPGKILSWATHPTDGNTLYLGGGDECQRGIYQSDDSGRTWTLIQKVENPPGYELDPSLDYLIIRMDWLLVRLEEGDVKVDYGPAWETPDSTGLVYAYCDPFLCKSPPGGQGRGESLRLGKPDVGMPTMIVISPHDQNTIYVAGKGIAVTKDNGQTWSKLNNGLGGMHIALETGGGNPPTLYLQQIEDCDLSINYDETREKEPGQPLYISNDGGKTWELAIQTGCYLIKDANGTTLYRIGRRETSGSPHGWLWRSKNSGRSWEKILKPNNFLSIAADQARSGLVYFYVDQAHAWPYYHLFYFSEDYGNEWKARDTQVDTKLCYGSTLQFVDKYRPVAIDPGDGNHVFVIENGMLLESHDSCDTTEPFAATPNTNMNSIAFDPNNATTIYAGTDRGVYVSFDGGETWNEINDGLLGATVVYSIVVDKDSNVYAATPYGVFKLENK